MNIKAAFVTWIMLFSLSLSAQVLAATYHQQINFDVLDNFGAPVSGANLAVSAFDHWAPGESFGKDVYKTVRAKTDSHGNASISVDGTKGEFFYGVEATPGFYPGGGGRLLCMDHKDGQWLPYGSLIPIVLQRVVHPIAMYAKHVGALGGTVIPVEGSAAGYDLLVGDWVSPWGKGVTPDVLFNFTEEVPYTTPTSGYKYALSITFNGLNNGLISQPIKQADGTTSVLRLRTAPLIGYSAGFKFTKQRHEGSAPTSDQQPDQNYYLRIRSIIDDHGKLVSSLYGKIYGNIDFDQDGRIQFNYYLNPTPNDTNVEFDPEKNLMTNLDRLEAAIRDP